MFQRVNKTKTKLIFPLLYPPKPTLLLSSRNFTTQSSSALDTAAATATDIANLVLESDPKTLRKTLHGLQVQFTPQLVDKVLKRLWFHGPKALQFFKHLEYHPTYAHSSSSFDHAIDIAGRMRDYKTLWALVARMRARRIGPSSKTFAIVAERFVGAGKPDRAIKVFLAMREHGCGQDLHSFNTILDILYIPAENDRAIGHTWTR